MAYQALYRTWRPQKFSDMIGQEVITKTLKNAIMTGQTSHAYLFNGPRGTGKTSAAKIFAKAVNCLNPIDGEPDNTCEICQAIDNGTIGDVMELDAASNNSVEQIRDIREDVNYAPTMAKYKVYIIDEVHMLSTGAFNALLKTLEEPPANVIFILATTEPQKIPATIISRTQRFDFKRISAEDAYARMSYILTQRGDTFDEAALRVIANAADGGMRDALSILDQTLSFGDGHVTLENALLVTGSVTQTLLGQYISATVKQDVPQALAKLAEVLRAGKDANRFVEDLISYARDLLLYTEAPELVSLVPDEEFKVLAQGNEPTTWYRMIDTLNETQQQLRYTNRPSIYLEVLTVKLSQPSQLTQVSQVVSQHAVQVAKRSVSEPTAPVKLNSSNTANVQGQPAESESAKPVSQPSLVQTETVPASTAPQASPVRQTVPKASADQVAVFNLLAQATKGDLQRVRAVWSDLLASLDVPQQAMLNVAQPLAASPDGVLLAFDYDVIRANALKNIEMQNILVTKLQTMTQSKAERQLVMINQEDWPQLRAKFVAERKKNSVEPAANQAVEHDFATVTDEKDEAKPAPPIVTKALDIFGSDLVEITEE
ncbi:DNA polymerase III subunit gamma/tau [Weissella oryzae SG25]|uniref:DNA-directed DNA polymerase n=1 Tax=Weissella oryzae (strain DSM 25784 / JCM 18191 / LMG 30913 / SG25) TaxID=1329250 RepID=A0A069CQN8_WEIOS|nr:DNA polymerase III subunit gamma/tau [Weissella oryzae]GAK30000.1 DNA polymerase III subunit gamma/tau [Weissella oryzae SG25]